MQMPWTTTLITPAGSSPSIEQPRGAIISADGVTLAQSVPSKDQYKYQRVYPKGALFGQITGYFSFTYGTDGLESQYNSALTAVQTPR